LEVFLRLNLHNNLTCGSYLAALPLCQDADGDNCKVASNMLQVVMPRLTWGSPSAYAEKGPVTSSVKIGDIIPTKTATKEKKLV